MAASAPAPGVATPAPAPARPPRHRLPRRPSRRRPAPAAPPAAPAPMPQVARPLPRRCRGPASSRPTPISRTSTSSSTSTISVPMPRRFSTPMPPGSRPIARNLVLIEGHCDERGTAEYNLALGERRAKSTMNYLVGQGVAGEPHHRHLLRQGAAGLHREDRGLLGEEPPRASPGEGPVAPRRESGASRIEMVTRHRAKGSPGLPFAVFPALGCLLFARRAARVSRTTPRSRTWRSSAETSTRSSCPPTSSRGQTEAIAQIDRRSREQSSRHEPTAHRAVDPSRRDRRRAQSRLGSPR